MTTQKPTHTTLYTFTGTVADVDRAGLVVCCDVCGSALTRKAVKATRQDGMEVYLGPDCAGAVKVRSLTARQIKALRGEAAKAYWRAMVATWAPRAEAAWHAAGRPSDCDWAVGHYSTRPWMLVQLLKARGHLPADWVATA